jgi:hypothetical protein
MGVNPDWFGPAAFGAALAALGYVGRLLVEWIASVRTAKAARRAKLAQLSSLLRAAWVAFVIQNNHAKRLAILIRKHHQDPVDSGGGYERLFTSGYPTFTDEERELHDIIRTITTNTLRPTNQALLEWVQQDVVFKGLRQGSAGELAKKLSDLEAHLLLWHAKYETWIPQKPEHALVYMADEQEHGLGFPKELNKAVEQALGRKARGAAESVALR